MSERLQAKQVLDQHRESILSRPNVVGVGTGYKTVRGQRTDQVGIVVLVSEKLPKAGLGEGAMIASEVDGVPTDVIEVGVLRAQPTPTDRWRPAPGGVSIGHYRITAGTLGAIVRDRATGARLILSNNHVLANSNDAILGDAILQPGPADGGQTGTATIARLERFVTIQFSSSPGTCSVAHGVAKVANALAGLVGSKHRLDTRQSDPQASNLVDAAVAMPDEDADVLDEIHEIGKVSGTVEAGLTMPVLKSGRTTGFTAGQVIVLDTTVNINYGTLKKAQFTDQIVTSPMSQGGDSGSLVVERDSFQAVGLLFAGSDQSTIISPIQAVLDALAVDL